MEYTAQNVEYAVSVFYNGEPADQAKAHTWLTSAQRVQEAWNFVWELLQPNKGTEVQFYAATTLHTKILRCWNEVPPENYDQLQEKLLQAVFTYSKGLKIVTNRLCISLAALILQQGTIDLAAILRPLSSEENTSLLLEVLTVIPEEYNSMTMGSSLRAKNRTALRQACPAVLDDMLRYLQSVYNDYSKEPPSEEIVLSWSRAANCATSWLTIDGEESNVGPSLPDRMPLCQALFTVVHVLSTCNEIVSDTALDACEACLTAARAGGGAGDASRHPNSAMQLLASLAALAAPVMARSDVPNSPNEDLMSAILTCCVALGSTHARSIVETIERYDESEAARAARSLLEILLAGQAAPGHYPIHETRSNLIFGFWYTLQDEILHLLESKSDMKPVWREVFSQLLTVLVVKSEAPAEMAMSKDDLELLRCYRQDIADSLMYCFAILGDWCWSTVENAYNSAANETRREAALHVFLALADAAPHEKAPAPLLNMLQNAILQANTSQDKRTVNTALDCLGSYAAWLSSVGGTRGASLARDAVRACGAALSRCPPAAALALRKLCADCAAPAADLAPDIVRAAQQSCVGAEVWTRRQLVGAAGAALSVAEPALALRLLRDLAATLHDDLTLQAQEPTAVTGAAECVSALTVALCNRPDLVTELFRLLVTTLPAFAVHPNLVEPMFNILKHTVAELMSDGMPLVTQIAELTVTGLNTCPCAAGLDVVKLVVLLMGPVWEGSREVLRCGVSCAARGVASAPNTRPDLAEGLFVLLAAVTKKRPQYLDWIDDLLPELVELGSSCVRVWEARAARASCTWLGALAGARPLALQPHAAALTASALRCIAGATPRNQIEPLAELLLSLNRAQWSAGGELSVWLREALHPPAALSPHASPPHVHKFIAAVIKEKSSKRRLLETVQEFSLVCRGLVGTEYARQSIASKQLVS